jgi:hypothetical protein
LILLNFNACGPGAGTDADVSSDSPSEDSSLSLSLDFVSKCGLVEDGESKSFPEDVEIVAVEVLDSDTVAIIPQESKEKGEKQIVKFHGLSSGGINDFRKLHGMDVLKRKVSGGAYFIPAGKDCDVVLSGGAQGILGQLYSLNGENINEFILAQGAAMPSSDICGGAVLSRCYGNIPLATRPPSDVELNLQDVSLSSQCGGVYKGVLRNPLTKAELVKIKALSGSEAIVTRQLGLESGNPQIVKLHGLYTI